MRNHITSVTLHHEKYPLLSHYPFSLPIFNQTKQIVFDFPVTFFVGENGTGKSTLLEALARASNTHIWNKSEGRRYQVNLYEKQLYEYLSLEWANGKVLIGSSNNLPAILNRFRAELKMGNCRNLALQEEWKQFGPEVFEFNELEILKPLDDPSNNPTEDLHFLEELWTEKLEPYGDKGYNKPPKNVS